VLRNTKASFYDSIIDRDSFGQPVGLNYKGSDSFKTMPGAFFSIFAQLFVLVVFAQTVLKMVGNEKWSLTEQTLILDNTELRQTLDLGSFSNLTLGAELRPSIGGGSVLSRDDYENFTSILNRFMYFSEVSY